MDRKLIAGIGLGVGIAAVLYALLVYNQYMKPVPSHAAPVFSYPEHDEEIQKILTRFEQDPVRGKEEFIRLSRRIQGGKQWLLLKMAASINKKKNYASVKHQEEPVLRLAAEKQESRILMTVTVMNPGSTFIHVPQIPQKAEFLLSNGQGDTRTLSVGSSLFGDPAGSNVLTLKPGSFWGISVPFPSENLPGGTWNIMLRLTYSKKDINGLNVIQGTYRSNRITLEV